MRYDNITRAKFISRPNRFIAEVELEIPTEKEIKNEQEAKTKREKTIVHVKNTGRCKELLLPGCEVWLTAPGTPNRKTKYDLVAVRKNTGVLFNIDSQAPNKVVKEWLDKQSFTKIIPEYTFGDSRIDFYMEKGEEKYLMEVKGCTLEIDGVGYFPDAPTERGVKHIRELIKASKEGIHSSIAFVIQMEGVTEVRPYVEMHPEFGEAMEDAKMAGVDILFLCCHVETDKLEIVSSACFS